MTFHRPSNVDDPKNLKAIIDSICKLSQEFDCIFPVHPRTKKILDQSSLYDDINNNNIKLLDPLGYIDFMSLQKNSSVVITDSGGIQEESSYFGVPCLTVRDSTERPITITHGSNKLIGNSYTNIVREAKKCIEIKKISSSIPDLWDGKASERILDSINLKYL